MNHFLSVSGREVVCACVVCSTVILKLNLSLLL